VGYDRAPDPRSRPAHAHVFGHDADALAQSHGDASKTEGAARYAALRQLGAVVWIASFVAAMVWIGFFTPCHF
jgi:hypothetical protein